MEDNIVITICLIIFAIGFVFGVGTTTGMTEVRYTQGRLSARNTLVLEEEYLKENNLGKYNVETGKFEIDEKKLNLVRMED